jgi:drug/metabolite transporter (DMT)-like permease
MLTALFVLARIVANPFSNVFQKQLTQRSAHPVFIIGAVHALLTVSCLPFVVVLNPLADLAREVWANMVVCASLAVAGNVLLVYALKSTDLSILGPINAYKSVVSLVLGIFLIGELPTAMGVAGIILILAGSYLVVDRDVTEPRRNAFVEFFRERGIQLRFAALGLAATEAVFLKKAILLSSPLTTFVLWSVLGLPIAAAAIVILLKGNIADELLILQKNVRTYLWLAIMTGLMQMTTVLTFGKLQVGYSLALFQMSTLLSVFLGYRYFQESNIRKRLAGSIVMVAGAVMIVVFGSRR